jgi:predicted MFS family arabinose efflux permease
VPAVPQVLKQRDYRLLFSGYVASLLGDGMVGVALAFAVLDNGGSPSELGLVLAARLLALLACLLVGGVLADRIERRKVMIAADLTRLISQGVLATLLIQGRPSIATIALLTAVTGAATGFFNPASSGLLPLVVKPELLQQANGLRGTAQAAGEIGGPLLAGLLVVAASPGWALAIDAVTFAVSAAFLTRLRLPAHVNTARQSFIKELKQGWGAFTEHTWVWSFVFAIAVGNIFWAAWSALGPVVAKQELGGAAAWGTVLAAMGAGGVLGGAIAIRANPRRPMLLVVGTGPIFATPIALLAAHAHTALLAFAAFCSGVVLVLGNAIWESTLQRQISREEMSRVSAYDWFGSLAFYPLGLALWGPVSDQIGIYPSLWLAFALISAIMFTLFAVKDIYRLTNARPSRDAPEPAAPR